MPEPQIIVQTNEVQDAAAEALGVMAAADPGDALSESVLTQVTAQAFFQPVIEEVAFGLNVDEYSGVVSSDVGFHIVQTTNYAADREINPDALWLLQVAALEDWLATRQAETVIEIFVP